MTPCFLKCDVTKILFSGYFKFGLKFFKKLVEVAINDKFQLELKNNDRDICNYMRTYFLLNLCILRLDLKITIQAKNTVVCMTSLLLSNGHI